MEFLHKDREQFLEAINLTEHTLSQSEKKKLKLIIVDIVTELGLKILNLDETRSRRDYNKYVIAYDTVLPMINEAMQPEILIYTNYYRW